MATDHSSMKLGKRPRRHDARTLKLARYMTPALLNPPARVDYTGGITDWGMMLNDKLGCCTIAAVGHAVQTWTANVGSELTVPDSAILNYYEKWDGYNPADPATDQGGVELDVLNRWRKQGFSNISLDAYVAVAQIPDFRFQIQDVATAIWLFGGAYIGVELPVAAQNQDIWDVPANPGPDGEPGSWGGHAIYLVGYDIENSGLGIRGSGSGIEDSRFKIQDSETPDPAPRTSDSRLRAPDSAPRTSDPRLRTPDPAPRTSDTGLTSATLTCITWGQIKKMTWAWFEKYCSEAYALVSKDWLNATGVSPSGFDLATLESDLKLVTG